MNANSEPGAIPDAEEILIDLIDRFEALRRHGTDPLLEAFALRTAGEVHAILTHLWPTKMHGQLTP